MGRLTKAIMALAMLLASACTSIHPLDIKPDIPSMKIVRKYPVKAALLIQPSAMNITSIELEKNTCPVSVSISQYPFGKYFKDIAYGTFSQLFDDLEVIQSIPAAKTYDYIIDMNFTRLSFSYLCSTYSANRDYKTEGSVKLLDGSYTVVWPGYTESATHSRRQVEQTESDVMSSKDIAGSMAMLLKKMGNDLNAQIGTRVKKSSTSQLAATGPSADMALLPTKKSDVDVLPLVKPRKAKNAYAVVIGIEQYRQKMPHADYATNDAQTVAEYLTQVLGYPEENVVTLLNDRAALGDFEKYFEKWLPNNVEPGSTVFVYYSGHGAPNPQTFDAYLVPFDGDPSFIEETGFSLKRMYAALGKLKVKEVVVALDSCFSGGGGRSVIAKGARPLVMNLQSNAALSKNMTVLSASSGDQISSTYDEKGHGLFTYFMLKGIKNEDVVRKDGSLKIDDLYSYIKPQVERIARKQYNNEQTPQLIESKR